MPSLSHAAIRALLPNYAARRLDASQRATVEAHLATCAECRAELAQWQTLNGWAAQAEAAIPPDRNAARSLAAIHARLGRTAGANTVESSTRMENHAMPYQNNSPYPGDRPYPGDQRYPNDRPYPGERTYPGNGQYPNNRPYPGYGDYGVEAQRYPTPSQRRPPTAPINRPPTPTSPAPQRRVTAWVAAGSVLIFLALIAGLFYWFNPSRNLNKSATKATPTATIAPTATAIPTSGSWHVATNLPTTSIDIQFAPSAPQTGYYCDNGNSGTVPTSSAQWLYRSNDGGMTWRALPGITTPSVSTSVRFECNVFVNASNANDVFVEVTLWPQCTCAGGQPATAEALWRSQNGGASWLQLNAPPVAGETTGVLQNIIVAGSRLIGLEGDQTQAVAECSTDPNADPALHVNDLVASDDGGKTWNTIGQSIYNQGLSVSDKGGWVVGGQPLQSIGGAIVVQARCESLKTGSAVDYASDWISHDNGVSWSQLPVNGGSDIEAFQYASAPSSKTYGMAVDLGSGGGYGTLPIVRYSDDSGATWRALPSLSFMPDAQTVGATFKVGWAMLMPDGSVLISAEVDLPAIIATTQPGSPIVTLRQAQTLSSGVYAINPNSANPAWRSFAMNPGGVVPSGVVSRTAQGWVLWGSTYDSQTQKTTYYTLAPIP